MSIISLSAVEPHRFWDVHSLIVGLYRPTQCDFLHIHSSLAVIECWSRIGCPGELLAGHLRENVSFLPSIVERSKYWDQDAQISLLSQFCNMIITLKVKYQCIYVGCTNSLAGF